MSLAAEEVKDSAFRRSFGRSHPCPVSPRFERKPVGKERQRSEYP